MRYKMGDMADLFLNEVLEHEEAIEAYHHGEMPIEEAYDKGIVNELGGEERGLTIRSRTCRLCNKTGLRWVNVEGKWRLFEGKTIHKCPIINKRP